MQLAKHQRRPRLELKNPPHPDNLHARYRDAQDPVERARWHALWLLATGHSIPEVAKTLGYSQRWVRTVVHRYNQGGMEAMTDLRHRNRGKPPSFPQRSKRPSAKPCRLPIPGMACGPSATQRSGFPRGWGAPWTPGGPGAG
ncbi:helix-turn-helix domain-containing protein [Thermus caliditerrae]|uniref:helix-turn-helix domain-containing protein n=1 Tax=Thermus caliditerrae TaxID=1330700 RepID=UPI000A51C647|nr:helix-turn-helix domain-containing protein [Thermus caliditerrae]